VACVRFDFLLSSLLGSSTFGAIYEFLYWAATEPLGDGRQETVFVVRRHSLT